MTIFVEKAIVFRRSVPSRGFCFPRKTCPEKTAWPLGVAFLAGAFVFPEKRILKKSMAPRRSVPSRGFCFPRKTRLNKNPWPLGVAFLAGAFFSAEKRVLKKREGG